MSLTPGTRLGSSYDITAAIGSGGMGEVYRATDLRLGRQVALKVLPTAFARDPERLSRFEREARALAALNHPNIAQVYGFEEFPDPVHPGSSIRALVMELLEGESLRERLAAASPTGLPVRKAVEYASQIARGLAAAHERGLIHRDLKPENVFVLNDGQIKILDFGLARQLVPASSGATETMTGLHPPTDPGTVMGTVGYMAPEQVRGGPLDARTDLFALGCVLYEMLTGQRAFRRDTAAETMTAVLNEDPPEFPTSRSDLNPALDRIVRHCLEKNPNERFQTARDVAFALNALSGSSSAPLVPVSAARSSWSPRIWAALSVALAGVVVWQALAPRFAAPAAPPVVYRTSVLLPEGFSGPDSPYPSLRLAASPDGQHVAITGALPGQKQMLWIQSLTSSDIHPVPGSEGALGPFWSPDSRRVAYMSLKNLVISSLDGTPPTAVGVSGAGSWGLGDVILVGKTATPVWKTTPGGAAYVPLISPGPREGLGIPWFLPGGQRFLYRYRNIEHPDQDGIYASTLDGKERTRVLANSEWSNINVAYASGALLFTRGSTLLAQPFDPTTLALSDAPVTLADDVDGRNSQGSAFSVSNNGTLVYQRTTTQATSRLKWFARNGQVISTLGDDADYSNVELSPDGQRLAVSVTDPVARNRDIFIVDIARGVRQRLTFDPSDERSAIWSADGRRVIYNSKGLDLYERSSDFTGAETPILVDGTSKDPRQVSPDGKQVIYRRSGETTGNDIWVLPLAGDHTPRLLVGSPFNENYPAFSPDGRAIVYASNESGQSEIYVMMLEGAGGKTQISTAGGTFPRWRRDGKEIFYLTLDNTMTSVDVGSSGAGFQAGASHALFKVDAQPGPGTPFDVNADGSRFIVDTAIPSKTQPAIEIVINWPSLLLARSPK